MGFDQADRGFSEVSRIALLVGFGGLLSIMALAGIDALHVLRQFREGDEQIRQRYLSQNHALNDIRSDVYVSGTYVRDYLLEPDPESAEAYRTGLEDVQKHMEAALESYGRQASQEEAQQHTALRAELTDYWATLAPVFKWDPGQRHRFGYMRSCTRRSLPPPPRICWLSRAGSPLAINDHQLTAGNSQVVALLLQLPRLDC